VKKSDVLHESHFIEMSDDVLKESLGYVYHRIKNLKDSAKTDPEIERLKGELKAYTEDNFTKETKHLSKMLKAACVVAELRGIRWKAPDEDSK
jgi:selenocysteine-specific translation elongation factor